MSQERDSFNSQLGFVLACVGSAVGMGNIWMFPWRVGALGGAIFLIQYFLFVFVLGVIGLIGELALGRHTKTGPMGAFDQALKTRNKSWGAWLGSIPMFGALGIAIGYSVVVGWIVCYLWGSITGSLLSANPGEYFGAITGDFGSIKWHLSALVITIVILLGGVSEGIEKANKFMMPVFYILFMILLVRVLTLPNIGDGIKYLLVPQWEMLKDSRSWVFALGQAFFSLSLAGSSMTVYGSYFGEKENIVDAALQTALYSSIGALLCAFVVIPAVFAYGVDPTAGPPLIFLSLTYVFQQMPLGQLFAILFFTSVLFAAVTSLISLMECPIEALQNRFNLSRVASVLIIGAFTMGVGVFIENGAAVGAWMDMVSIYVIPLGASLAGIAIFWIFGMDTFYKEVAQGADKPLPKWFTPLAKYLFCGVSVFIIILSISLGGL